MNFYEQFCKASCQCSKCVYLINEAPNEKHGYQQKCQASGLNITSFLNKRPSENCPCFKDMKPEFRSNWVICYDVHRKWEQELFGAIRNYVIFENVRSFRYG